MNSGYWLPILTLSGTLLPLILGAALAFTLYPAFAGPKATQVSFVLLVGTAMAITARLVEQRREVPEAPAVAEERGRRPPRDLPVVAAANEPTSTVATGI